MTKSHQQPSMTTPSSPSIRAGASFNASYRQTRLAMVLAAATVLSIVVAPANAQDINTFQLANQAYSAGKYEEAALGFFDVSERSRDPELQWRAEYFLAHTLFKMGLHHSAYVMDSLIIQGGPQHPYYAKAIENMLEVMDAVGDKTLIPGVIDSEYNAEGFGRLDEETINRVNFLVALRSHQIGRLEDSEDFLSAVPEEASAYPQARYLRGVQLSQRATALRSGANPDPEAAEAVYEQAAEAFSTVLELKNTKDVTYDDLESSKQLATVALARLRYAQGRFDDAADLYERIPQYTDLWRDALFEGAYAAFVADDPGRALGLLHTLHSPIFANHLMPESWLLKSYIYFFSCLFDESKAALGYLQRNLRESYEAVTGVLEANHQPEFYYELLGSKGLEHIPASVRTEIRRDETLRGYRRYIGALEKELEQLSSVRSWQGSLLRNFLVEQVQQQRDRLVQTTGTGVQRALKLIEFTLEDIEGRGDILQLEMARRETELLQGSHDTEVTAASQKLGRPRVPEKNAEYWPFDTEFWPDEVGAYRYTIKNLCPADDADGFTASSR